MKISVLLAALSAAGIAWAGTFHDLGRLDNAKIVPGAYIVEYLDRDHQPSYSRHNNPHQPEASSVRDMNGLRSALKTRQVDYVVRTEYGIFNGAAIHVHSDHDGTDLAAIPGIKNVWPLRLFLSPKPLASTFNPKDPLSASLHSMTGVDILQRQFNLTGKGVKVGVIDTGIDYKHPAFALPGQKEGCFGSACRVAFGWDFVGDNYNGSNTPTPDKDPMDCQGHGSHVAGIIGANAMNITSPRPPQPFVGVAPDVTLGAYRIFGCDGQVGEDVIMAAMEKAFKDGMDIINLSLGGGSSYKTNAQAVLGDKLASLGLIVAAAAGNDGADGVWMVSDASLGDNSTSVASFDNIYGNYYSFTYGNATYPYSVAVKYGKPSINLPGNVTMVPLLTPNGTLSDGCDAKAFASANVTGKVVLALGNEACSSDIRATNAKKAGATAILTQTAPFGMATLGGIESFPMASLENKAGKGLLQAYKANAANTFTWSKNESSFQAEAGGGPSVFSSYGLDGDLRSKPDIGAPGGDILSTYPLKQGGYALLSGTSMATPYIAGANALYIQFRNGKLPADEIRKIFKNTAKISQNYGTKTFASVAKQGAGLLNVLNAIMTKASVSPDHVDLLDSIRLKKSAVLTFQSIANQTETYTLSHVPADALNSYPSKNATFPLRIPTIEADHAQVTFSQTQIVVPPSGSIQVNVTFQEPATGSADQFPIYSGYIVATPTNKDGVVIHVSYTGLKGDVSKVPIMDTARGFPYLRMYDVASGNLTKITNKGNSTFDMKKSAPVIQTRWGSHTPSGEIRVYDGNKTALLGFLSSENMGVAFGPAGREKYSDPQRGLIVSNWLWNGKIVAPSANMTAAKPTQLKSGSYQIVVACQRKFTKGNYPADYEVYDVGTVKF
ncbi:peptidase S8/S53 domain-containing protein [Mortierella sp. GBAus27b]|nr:hypothetical protein BGX31_003738 [Mortierella sp. GBA43]KAI8354252.1 peptidase S8/S53 domain-containing protein [Mortierella sp. GBAus27b]